MDGFSVFFPEGRVFFRVVLLIPDLFVQHFTLLSKNGLRMLRVDPTPLDGYFFLLDRAFLMVSDGSSRDTPLFFAPPLASGKQRWFCCSWVGPVTD